mmetsp:Transcript_25100/g.57723  ORF Transcript_25100/g.57723 Transcript_25100/m.57723 type:complete len:213 (-) Transcript_25100:348-986(-)
MTVVRGSSSHPMEQTDSWRVFARTVATDACKSFLPEVPRMSTCPCCPCSCGSAIKNRASVCGSISDGQIGGGPLESPRTGTAAAATPLPMGGTSGPEFGGEAPVSEREWAAYGSGSNPRFRLGCPVSRETPGSGFEPSGDLTSARGDVDAPRADRIPLDLLRFAHKHTITVSTRTIKMISKTMEVAPSSSAPLPARLDVVAFPCTRLNMGKV